MKQDNSFKMGTGTIVLVAFAVILVAGIWAVIERSDDAASDELNPAQTHPHTFAYAPNEDSVWLGTHTGIYELSEGRWVRAIKPLEEKDIMGLEVNATAPNKVIVSGHGFIMGTSTAGDTWSTLENGIPNKPKPDVPDAHLLTSDPKNPDHLFVFVAQESDNIYESVDGGGTWEVAGTVPVGAYAIAVPAHYSSDENSLLVGTEDGLYRYRLDPNRSEHEALSSEPTFGLLTREDGEVIALTESGMFRSLDGQRWTRMDLNLNNEMPLGIRASKIDPNKLLIVTNQFTAFESKDDGLTWSALK